MSPVPAPGMLQQSGTWAERSSGARAASVCTTKAMMQPCLLHLLVISLAHELMACADAGISDWQRESAPTNCAATDNLSAQACRQTYSPNGAPRVNRLCKHASPLGARGARALRKYRVG